MKWGILSLNEWQQISLMKVHKVTIGSIRIATAGYVDLPFIGVICGILLYYSFDWDLLIQSTIKATTLFLESIGFHVENYQESFVLVNGIPYNFHKRCTGIDWLLIVLPFVLDYSKKMLINIRNIILLISGWFCVNLVRLWITMGLASRGYSWSISHHIPYLCLYYGTILIIVGTWSKNRIRIKFIKKRE
ncbi:MAG TPA: hypothetical protein PKY88_11100, partial [Anaerohalosphaeraceae bacterium]|nr:hypothetical protein [Anaerohalosphaeraceae bacterium]